MQNHVEQRLMDSDAAVVFHKTEFAKATHEEADAGSRGPDSHDPISVKSVEEPLLEKARPPNGSGRHDLIKAQGDPCRIR